MKRDVGNHSLAMCSKQRKDFDRGIARGLCHKGKPIFFRSLQILIYFFVVIGCQIVSVSFLLWNWQANSVKGIGHQEDTTKSRFKHSFLKVLSSQLRYPWSSCRNSPMYQGHYSGITHEYMDLGVLPKWQYSLNKASKTEGDKGEGL